MLEYDRIYKRFIVLLFNIILLSNPYCTFDEAHSATYRTPISKRKSCLFLSADIYRIGVLRNIYLYAYVYDICWIKTTLSKLISIDSDSKQYINMKKYIHNDTFNFIENWYLYRSQFVVYYTEISLSYVWCNLIKI